jgi:hypothetical protein
VAHFKQGRPFQLGFSVRNSGRFSVRILGVPLSGIHPFAVRELLLGPVDNEGTLPLEPFHAFTLEPGAERFILLRGIYANCRFYDASSTTGYDSMAVRMRFLHWTHTVRVPLNEALLIQMARSGDPCR